MSKRIFDLTAASIGILVLTPVMLAIAVAVKLDSPGPVFYLGTRVGRYGYKFSIFKFRTMCPDAERLGTTTAMNDRRITRLGSFLRRHKMDELPQLFNVMRGEMSLVGPRPEVEEHTNAYDADEKVILTVLPGITDYSSIHFVNLSEVLGSKNPHHVFIHGNIRNQKNQLRLKYVRNRSFTEDIKIIIRTLWAIFSSRPSLETPAALLRSKD